jgi:hypothetical protein
MFGLRMMLSQQKDSEVFLMVSMRSARWFSLAFLVFGAIALQQASAQLPVGTVRTGTFIWSGERWVPAEQAAAFGLVPAPPPAPAPEASDEEVTVEVAPPYTGALWTPGYWGWVNGRYAFHEGYWGPHIGFYGGVNYGGGYMGIGFAGGSWNGGVFAYNTAVVRVNERVVTNVYVNRTIVEQTTIINNTNVSFNGGPNGIQHQPVPEEQVAAHEQHQAPTAFQQQHVTAAKADTSNFAKNNGGHPTNLAATKPLAAETHAAPTGFKPAPSKPLTELAKVQAPPTTVTAAKQATAKTALVAKPVAKPMSNAAPAARPAAAAKPEATTEAKPETKSQTKPEAAVEVNQTRCQDRG